MIYNKIKKLCDKENIAVTKLEKELGFGNGTIKKWSNSDPAFTKVCRVAKYFDVPIDYFRDK